MREYPILMSAPMVRATLSGAKTQTRRIVRPQPVQAMRQYPLMNAPESCYVYSPRGTNREWFDWGRGFDPAIASECPYGGVGDRLWVREAWGEYHYTYGLENTPSSKVIFRADLPNIRNFAGWRPSIHMPKWACRLVLEILSIHVERLQDITEEDARAEGVEKEFRTVVMSPSGCKDYHIPNSYRGGFANLWDEISKREYGWDFNCWVWRIEFKGVV